MKNPQGSDFTEKAPVVFARLRGSKPPRYSFVFWEKRGTNNSSRSAQLSSRASSYLTMPVKEKIAARRVFAKQTNTSNQHRDNGQWSAL
jgi:hypothetical protein